MFLPVEDLKYEIEQWSVAITQTETDLQKIDRIIELLSEVAEALEECDTSLITQ